MTAIFAGLTGFVFFGFIACYMLGVNWNINGVDRETGLTIVKIFIGIFIFFSIACLSLVLNIKIFTLTDKTLTINKPLLFLSREIPLIQIKSINQSEDPVKISRGFSTTTIYTGKKTTIELENGKKIRFSSMEVGGYKSLIEKINAAIRKSKFIH